MKVLINGLGNIGSTLTALLLRYREVLGIHEILVVKNRPRPWETRRYAFLERQGITILEPKNLRRAGEEVSFIFDTTSNGGATARKDIYASFPRLLGAVAQGSEGTFGIPFMTGLNDNMVPDHRFFTVVSCNTHGILSVLDHFSGGDMSCVEDADFVVVRRSEDIGNHERLVSANVIARHRSELGTHHAADAFLLLKTIGMELNLSSSDITTPAQLMHGLRFNIRFFAAMPSVKETPFVGRTEYFDSNRIFEIGRRDGFQGRLYQHSILVSNNIIRREKQLFGWAFVPQEGNTILSTLKIFLLKTRPGDYHRIFETISGELLSVAL